MNKSLIFIATMLSVAGLFQMGIRIFYPCPDTQHFFIEGMLGLLMAMHLYDWGTQS
jgi:hypothetical protein